MIRSAGLLLLMLAATLSACGFVAMRPAAAPLPAANVAPAEATALPLKSGQIRINGGGAPKLADVPLMMAIDKLKAQGYSVQTVELARFDLAPTALVKGDLDIASASYESLWSAIAKGAKLRTVAGWLGNPYVVVTKAGIVTCAGLNNKNVAYGSTASMNAIMLGLYLDRTCPGNEPRIAVIPSSANRVSALLAGQIDAAVLEIIDALYIERQAPGQFHVLIRLCDEFPGVANGGYTVQTDFASEHPEILRDFIAALLQAHRQVQDKQALATAIGMYLDNDARSLAAMDAYLALNAWDVNGGLTEERVQRTLDFLTESKLLPAGLKVEQVSDLAYLNEVLAQIGKK